MSENKRKYWIVINDSGDHHVYHSLKAAQEWSSNEQEIVEVEEVLTKEKENETEIFCNDQYPNGKL